MMEWLRRFGKSSNDRAQRVAMSSPRLSHIHLWHLWILLSFWAAQMSILMVPVLELLLTAMMYSIVPDSRQWLARRTYLGLSLELSSFALVLVEYQLYIRAKLFPVVYLGFQIIRSIEPSWTLYYYIRFATRNRWYRPGLADIVEHSVYILTFWGAIFYALYTLILQYRQRRRHLRMTVSEQIQDLFPEKINTATNLKATSPVILKLVRWLNADIPWTTTLPAPFTVILEWIVYTAKYTLVVIPVIFLFSMNTGLPGEPFVATTSSNASQLAEWKYPKPYNLDPYSDSEAIESSRNARDLDEESAIDTVRLSTLNHGGSSTASGGHTSAARASSERLLTPRFLCFITETTSPRSEAGYVTRKVDESLRRSGEIDYVFISYTRRQFYSQIPNDPSISIAERDRFKPSNDRDTAILIKYAIAAAREAAVPAFWIDFECIQPEEGDATDSDIEEVYRICDIVRGSHSMAIVLGPALDNQKDHVQGTSKDEWLFGWGERLWTVPEALLCPSEHRISVYSAGNDTPEKVAKRNLPARVWDDAGNLRQLMDHYEASLHLTQLELISIALECLQRRQTEKRNAGDVAYALMGLLRLRPKVNKADSAFQAFARLSLANDSDMILERLICLGGLDIKSAWCDMTDAWDTKLWQVMPNYQIAGLGSNDTIIIGNASGALIDWTSLYTVDFTRVGNQHRGRWHFIRYITAVVRALLCVYYFYQFMCIAVLRDMMPRALKEMQHRIDIMVGIYGGLWLMLLFLMLPIPAILSRHFRSNLDTVQARFFGVQGRPSLGKVETYVFGANCGRLKWSADCVTEEVGRSDALAPEPVFTLIDTMSRTATTFQAETRPTMLFVGGLEQGMLRAVLCSYDLAKRRSVKETVIRLESAALQRMQRMDRFRFSIASAASTAPDTASVSFESDRISIPDIPEFRSLDE